MENLFFLKQMNEVNPFTPDGKYDETWVSLKINDGKDIINGKNIVFGCTIGKQKDGWAYRVMDYIHYNLIHRRKVIFIGDESDYLDAEKHYAGYSIYDRKLRFYEPKILVHSTTKENYEKIMKDGYLKSWNRLKDEDTQYESQPIGTLLGDPKDLSDYVMLGGGVHNEIVVLSKQRRYLCFDTDAEYTPGARFYFDAEKLAKQGLLVRDGLHYKVKDQLSIEEVVFIATTENVIMNGKTTPKTFAEAADNAFEKECAKT